MNDFHVKTEILINSSPHETRVAILEDGQIHEIHFERPTMRGIVGNIYKGKVVRVLPGMQAAFVDIGLERAGFLHVSDVMPFTPIEEEALDLTSPEADVRKWLYEGQDILIQVTKDPLGSKGARLTSHLSIASRYLVYMPDLNHIGISLRLDTEEERERLQNIMKKILKQDEPKNYIIRTVADGATKKALSEDKQFLDKMWTQINVDAKKAKAPKLVFEDLPLVKRVMRDIVTENVQKVHVDSKAVFKSLKAFTKALIPNVEQKLELYQSATSLFEMYSVEKDIQNALKRTAPLPSGGYLVIDQTEAMNTIDINTGGFVGSENLEETIFKTNLEAAYALGRQIRLRNLGGMIIIDFIDMQKEEHKQQLHETLTKVLERDYAKNHISEISNLGLVQMTRKRTHESIAQQLCDLCPECDGRGSVKTVRTLSYEIFRELIRSAKAFEKARGFCVIAAPKTVQWLLEEASEALGEVESTISRPIKLKAEPNFLKEQYDIVLI